MMGTCYTLSLQLLGVICLMKFALEIICNVFVGLGLVFQARCGNQKDLKIRTIHVMCEKIIQYKKVTLLRPLHIETGSLLRPPII